MAKLAFRLLCVCLCCFALWPSQSLEQSTSNLAHPSVPRRLLQDQGPCFKEDGFDYWAVPENVLDSKTGMTVDSCCDWCRSSPGCRVWTFIKSAARCWLVKGPNNRSPNSDVISGTPSTSPPSSPTPSPNQSPAPSPAPSPQPANQGGTAGAGPKEGDMYCWGNQGSAWREYTPKPVQPGSKFVQGAAGLTHVCGLLKDSGDAACLWSHKVMQLKQDGKTEDTADHPVQPQVPGPFKKLAGGMYITCGLLRDSGKAMCWGDNTHGLLGNGALADYSGPVAVAGDSSYTDITVGTDHACGLLTDGSVECWGSRASPPVPSKPVKVPATEAFTQISAGREHTCGILKSGTAICWGWNSAGQLGTGNTQDTPKPTPVVGGHKFVQISASWGRTCGITTEGKTWCWGDNTSGALGTGDSNYPSSSTPRQVDTATDTSSGSSLKFVQVTAGADETCALTSEGKAYCWGNGNMGQLGTATPSSAAIPQAVDSGGLMFSQISSGGGMTCAIVGTPPAVPAGTAAPTSSAVPTSSAAGSTVPSDSTSSVQPSTQDPFVLRQCPGNGASKSCLPGTDTLQSTPSGCCACRKTKPSGSTPAYPSVASTQFLAYGQEPSCKEPVAQLPPSTIVDYTGAKVSGDSVQGCPGGNFAQIVLQEKGATATNWKPYWVAAADLEMCNAGRACGTKPELGASCALGTREGASAECCAIPAEGGHPSARCWARVDKTSYCGLGEGTGILVSPSGAVTAPADMKNVPVVVGDVIPAISSGNCGGKFECDIYQQLLPSLSDAPLKVPIKVTGGQGQGMSFSQEFAMRALVGGITGGPLAHSDLCNYAIRGSDIRSSGTESYLKINPDTVKKFFSTVASYYSSSMNYMGAKDDRYYLLIGTAAPPYELQKILKEQGKEGMAAFLQTLMPYGMALAVNPCTQELQAGFQGVQVDVPVGPVPVFVNGMITNVGVNYGVPQMYADWPVFGVKPDDYWRPCGNGPPVPVAPGNLYLAGKLSLLAGIPDDLLSFSVAEADTKVLFYAGDPVDTDFALVLTTTVAPAFRVLKMTIPLNEISGQAAITAYMYKRESLSSDPNNNYGIYVRAVSSSPANMKDASGKIRGAPAPLIPALDYLLGPMPDVKLTRVDVYYGRYSWGLRLQGNTEQEYSLPEQLFAELTKRLAGTNIPPGIEATFTLSGSTAKLMPITLTLSTKEGSKLALRLCSVADECGKDQNGVQSKCLKDLVPGFSICDKVVDLCGVVKTGGGGGGGGDKLPDPFLWDARGGDNKQPNSILWAGP